MTVYADFTSDEQDLLRASLAAAAMAVSAASPGRKEETVSEGFAAASFILGSRAEQVANTLVSSVIVELEQRAASDHVFPDYVELASTEGAQERAMETLRSVAVLLDEKVTPAEASGYKAWLLRIAKVTAEAGKEDQGFLGRGGVAINDAERAALQWIAEVLGLPFDA